MQHLLSRSVWDHNAVRDDVRAYLVEHLGDPEAVLVVDEPGNLKKGTTTVGVQRQYTGTAGRIENAQVAVYPVYASDAGHALIDRELYVPQGWIDSSNRLQAAGIADQVGLVTKPALAQAMLTLALNAAVPAAWVTGDEVYGADPRLRAELEARGVGYVVGGGLRPPHPGRWRHPSGRRPAQACPGTGLVVCVGWARRQGPPVVRVGVPPPGLRRA
jgi:SRSO17 transposase